MDGHVNEEDRQNKVKWTWRKRSHGTRRENSHERKGNILSNRVCLRISYVCSGNSLILDVLIKMWKLMGHSHLGLYNSTITNWLGNYLDKMTDLSCHVEIISVLDQGWWKQPSLNYCTACAKYNVIPVKLNNLTKPRKSDWVFSVICQSHLFSRKYRVPQKKENYDECQWMKTSAI